MSTDPILQMKYLIFCRCLSAQFSSTLTGKRSVKSFPEKGPFETGMEASRFQVERNAKRQRGGGTREKIIEIFRKSKSCSFASFSTLKGSFPSPLQPRESCAFSPRNPQISRQGIKPLGSGTAIACSHIYLSICQCCTLVRRGSKLRPYHSPEIAD